MNQVGKKDMDEQRKVGDGVKVAGVVLLLETLEVQTMVFMQAG